MCNFAAQLKHVASKEKLVDIQWDNIIARAFLKLSKKARYKWGQGTGPCPPYNKEYTYALACKRKIDVSYGLQVTHTSYDNDDDNNKRNS